MRRKNIRLLIYEPFLSPETMKYEFIVKFRPGHRYNTKDICFIFSVFFCSVAQSLIQEEIYIEISVVEWFNISFSIKNPFCDQLHGLTQRCGFLGHKFVEEPDNGTHGCWKCHPDELERILCSVCNKRWKSWGVNPDWLITRILSSA